MCTRLEENTALDDRMGSPRRRGEMLVADLMRDLSGSERGLTEVSEQMVRHKDDLVSSWSDDRKLIVRIRKVVCKRTKGERGRSVA